jgi:2-keto-3-deoxy-6-phosphogluconate aldolase
VPLARALVAGGLPILEITLRTPTALDVIRAIAGEVEGAVVGAGTVLSAAQYRDAVAVGSRFVVSPGATEAVLEAAAASPVPLLPGVATASEVMRLLERGYRFLKFFPAAPAGGVAYLKALAAPLPEGRMRGVVVAAAIHVTGAGRRHDRVLGVVADRDEIEMRHSLNLTLHSVAASSIDTALDPIQNVIAGSKS